MVSDRVGMADEFGREWEGKETSWNEMILVSEKRILYPRETKEL